MFQIKRLAQKDYEFAVDLANTMDWNMATEDFEFMASLEPEGCFVLVEGSKRLGIATCISYGKVGWFGNLIIKPEYRNRGGGSALVNHALAYLNGKGVETVGLYAYSNLVDFYESLGFNQDEDFSVLHSERVISVSANVLPMMQKRQFPAINKLDSQCFGGDRKRLLESIILDEGNVSYCISEGRKTVGYVAATVYDKMAWIGPLVCQDQRQDDALLLVRAVLAKLDGKSVYTVVSKKDTLLIDAFTFFGLTEEFSVSRMFHGKPVGKNCIYIAESLERG
jgi:GNAT superfamily N-acetyltransferase